MFQGNKFYEVKRKEGKKGSSFKKKVRQCLVEKVTFKQRTEQIYLYVLSSTICH